MTNYDKHLETLRDREFENQNAVMCGCCSECKHEEEVIFVEDVFDQVIHDYLIRCELMSENEYVCQDCTFRVERLMRSE